VQNNSSATLTELKFGVLDDFWDTGVLTGGETLAPGASRDIPIYPGVFDLYAAASSATYVWNPYDSGNPGSDKVFTVHPGQTVNYTLTA